MSVGEFKRRMNKEAKRRGHKKVYKEE